MNERILGILSSINSHVIAWFCFLSFMLVISISCFTNKNTPISKKSESSGQFSLNLFTLLSLLIFMSSSELSADIILALLIACIYSFNKMIECLLNTLRVTETPEIRIQNDYDKICEDNRLLLDEINRLKEKM